MLKVGPPTMLGLVALIFVPLLVMGLALHDGQLKSYFPASVTHPTLTCGPPPVWREDAASLPAYFSALSNADEPSFFAASRSPDARRQRSFRFTIIGRNSTKVGFVRLDQLAGGRMRLVTRRFSSLFANSPTRMAQAERLLTPPEQARFEQALAAAHDLNLPPYSCRQGVDGWRFYFEANDAGAYRFVDRWAPQAGSLVDLAKVMGGLAGWADSDVPVSQIDSLGPDEDH